MTWVEGSCTSAATPPCWPCGGTAELSIHLDKPGREITAVLGGVNFSATWDGRCSTITGTVLAPDPDYYGTGDGCDYANATITLAASAQETSEPPVGPISNWCSECPKPRLMYFTISELGTLPCSGTDGGFDLSFLNGTWPLEAQSVLPNAMAGCGESDNGAESCDIWWLDLSAFDGTIIGYVGGQPVTVIANPALPPPSLAIYFPYQEAGGSHLVYQIVIPATYSGVSIFVKGYGQFTSSLTDSIPCLGVLALNRDWTSDVWCSSICASSMHPTGTMSVEGSA